MLNQQSQQIDLNELHDLDVYFYIEAYYTCKQDEDGFGYHDLTDSIKVTVYSNNDVLLFNDHVCSRAYEYLIQMAIEANNGDLIYSELTTGDFC